MCPLTSKNVLLNANYYIADCRRPSIIDDSTDDVVWNKEEQRWERKKSNEIKKATQYNIKYGKSGILDVGPYVTSLLSDGIDSPAALEKRIWDYLHSFNIMRSVYEEIYLAPRKGNGLLFIIYYSDEIIINEGRLVAQFLADNFGEDIIFVDPTYRSYVKGQSKYVGNKENAKRVEKDIRETSMFVGFKAIMKAAIKKGDVLEYISDLQSYMATYSFKDVIDLYNILWPNDPLPAGNYTTEEIKDLIIERCLDSSRTMPNILDEAPKQQNNGRFNLTEIYYPNY